MRGLEIQLNGRKLCTAGVRDDESLSVIVSYAPNDQFLYVGGSVGPDGDHAKWIDTQQISVGDVVTVKAIDTENPDEPTSVKKSSYALPKNWPPPDVTKGLKDGSPVRVACPRCKAQFSSEELSGNWHEHQQRLYELYSEHFRDHHAKSNNE